MPTDNHADALGKVAELIKEIRTAMLMTLDETGAPRSRPMYTQTHRVGSFTGQGGRHRRP